MRSKSLYRSCCKCPDFNIKNTIGEECEGNKHTFCDRSLAEHDAKIKEKTINEFVNLFWIKAEGYKILPILTSLTKEQIGDIFSLVAEQIKEENNE